MPYKNAYEELKFGKQKRRRTGQWIECQVCHETFYVPPSRIKQAKKHNVQIRCCSMKCRGESYKGEGNPFWGRRHTAYSKTKMVEHPNRVFFEPGPNNPNYHRFGPGFTGTTHPWWKGHLLETIGKCERCGYNAYQEILELHHIDRDRKNNERDNLLLLCPN